MTAVPRAALGLPTITNMCRFDPTWRALLALIRAIEAGAKFGLLCAQIAAPYCQISKMVQARFITLFAFLETMST